MKPSTFFRSLSFGIPARLSASTAVAPFPVQTQFDKKITKELENLQLQGSEYTSRIWLIHALEASITTQKIALESISKVMLRDLDRKVIDEYLDSSVEMLDACNNISEKLETMKTYVGSLKAASKLLEGQCEPNPTCLARARDLLDSCESVERRSCRLKKSCSKSKKLNQKVGQQQEFELSDILAGSNAVASMTCEVLGRALSFKSKRGFPATTQHIASCSWANYLCELQKRMQNGTLMLMELKETVKAAKSIRDQTKNMKQNGELRLCVVELKHKCVQLENGMRPLEERIKELYKHLISVRMALLGIISKA